MKENKFIKVLRYDSSCCDSYCIVNKDCIERFEIQNYYEDEYCDSMLYLKDGTMIIVTEDGIEPLQEELLGSTLKRKIKRTEKYPYNIDDYLDPKRSWDKSIGIGNRIAILKELTKTNKESIADKIKLMDYKDFLNTPYWKAISAYMKVTKRKCEICGNDFELHTHHKTYEHHGYELDNLDDLQVTCGVCHYKIHKEEKK